MEFFINITECKVLIIVYGLIKNNITNNLKHKVKLLHANYNIVMFENIILNN